MSYTPEPCRHDQFDNVFVNPEAYRSFVATGTWPDKTVMVLERRGASSKGSINQSGHYQGTGADGDRNACEGCGAFPRRMGILRLFNSPTANGKLISADARLATRAIKRMRAVDTTFVQFYPTLLPIAQDKKTLSDAFLKEEAAQAAASK